MSKRVHAASSREQLVAQLETDLKLINGTGDYNNAVKRVSRDMEVPEIFPYIIIEEEGEEKEADASGREIHMYAMFNIWMFLQGSTNYSASQILNSGLRDIQIAMLGTTAAGRNNRTHQGTCHHTEYLGMNMWAEDEASFLILIAKYRCDYSFRWANLDDNT